MADYCRSMSEILEATNEPQSLFSHPKRDNELRRRLSAHSEEPFRHEGKVEPMPNPPDAETLYNRATQSAKETRKAVVTLSSASLGVFFLALTTKVDPALTDGQRWIVLIALCLMACAISAGLWSASSDARWSYAWGRELENREEDDKEKEAWAKEKDAWHKRKRWGERYSLRAFALGVLVAGIYVALRALGA
jgi:hypothetical protein